MSVGGYTGSPIRIKPCEGRNQQAKGLALSISLSTDSLVCGPCRDDFRRVLADLTYVARWEKGKSVGNNINCFGT